MKMPIFLLVLVALLVRLPAYTTSPKPADNRDELAWAWAGQSLILEQSPSSWSWSGAYPDRTIVTTYDGGIAPYVHPWLDHPPLFALLVGAAALVAGQDTPISVNSKAIRWVPILLSLVSMVLLYVLARRLVGKWATLGAALFALSPWAIEVSHTVEAEALLAPMFLGVLVLVEQKGRRSLAGVLALCLLAPIAKVVGVALGATAIVLLLLQRRWWASVAAGTASLCGLGVYVLYGLAIDADLFIAVLRSNSARHGSELVAAFQFLGSPNAGLGPLVPLRDPFWYIGLLVVGALILYWRDRRFVGLIIAVIVYTAVMGATGPDATGELARNGWYRITLYPLLFVAIAAGGCGLNFSLHALRTRRNLRMKHDIGVAQSFSSK